MQSLAELETALAQPDKPFDKWQPTHCGQLPISIDVHGVWFYAGSEIKREAMVKLFASVLCKEADSYYLKTPVEKMAITVADVPFIIVDWRFEETEQGNALCCIDNLQRTWLVTACQPLQLREFENVTVPYLKLPHGLAARVSRNVYYQWAEIASSDEDGYFIESLSKHYYLA
ncbi:MULTISPECIES: DUF1285 domain-containing protein [Pseudoalteromonas]|jgi:hypothetical protein|uniref:DUF1285 domain-containing protein n=1 Tax=Pseudoalteromonas TaxID=53246 RepID=UPI00044559A1|nr:MULTISPECIES: DUF1285 domain-containing protein [Pseudoalteromonas]EWH05846.1 hypothetical protein AT00_11930 [Pseudoalteromonas lipolytica SCSIO 04301]MAE01566.1 DUF1285 domain-containing protein [Pseudoalteromonas sp.]QMW14881.1 DUF1285 domain-containing protein [Pseudoalteromonas sp. MT33b]|tara:strand:- start:945 stop:1463 length:519 start_codon:yes stop_codon:yes gene_type:complete